MGSEQWWQQGWRALPAFRADLRVSRRQPLNVQFAGDLETLKAALASNGWKAPAELNGASWLEWFGFRHEIARLPVLPQVHDGRHEALLLVRPMVARRDRMFALRMWRSAATLTPGDTPLWIGSVGQMGLYAPVPGFAAPRSIDQFRSGRSRLDRDLGQLSRRTAERIEETFSREVLLVRERP
jgi:undecaprenyl-diphosphatase